MEHGQYVLTGPAGNQSVPGPSSTSPLPPLRGLEEDAEAPSTPSPAGRQAASPSRRSKRQKEKEQREPNTAERRAARKKREREEAHQRTLEAHRAFTNAWRMEVSGD